MSDPLEQLADALEGTVVRSVPGQLMDASELAARLGVTRGWVYEHAQELGALRLGGGPRPRLRFDPLLVDEALRTGLGQTRTRPRRRRKSSRSKVELLPIAGVRSAHEPSRG